MPTIQGTGGSVTLPGGFNARLNHWSAVLMVETVDTTGYEDHGYRTREPVMVTLSGMASGFASFMNEHATPVSPAVLGEAAGFANARGDVVLQAAPGCAYSFHAVMKRVTLARPVDGRCDVTFEFESSGQIVQSWDEATSE